jgi:hypothetical protein
MHPRSPRVSITFCACRYSAACHADSAGGAAAACSLPFGGFEAMAALRGAAGAHRRIAVLAARLTQAAGTVHWGGRRAGLRRALAEGPTLDALGCFVPKFRRVAEALLPPPGTEPLETKHLVYSGSKSTNCFTTRSRAAWCLDGQDWRLDLADGRTPAVECRPAQQPPGRVGIGWRPKDVLLP